MSRVRSRRMVFNVGTTSDAYSAVFITSSTTGESELRMGDTDTDAGSIAYTNSDDTMTFRAAAGARMALDSTGIDVTGSETAVDFIQPTTIITKSNGGGDASKQRSNLTLYGGTNATAATLRATETSLLRVLLPQPST